MFGRQRRKHQFHELHPDDVLLDGNNKPGFNAHQLEGVIERPINSRTGKTLGALFLFILAVMMVKITELQIVQGAEMFALSEDNRLRETPLFSERGIIYDRNGVELAWNTQDTERDDRPYSLRDYINEPGFGHLLGYVGYPERDRAGYYWRDEIIGREGAEKLLNNTIAGDNGVTLHETTARLVQTQGNLTIPPTNGQNAYLTIDARIQSAFHKAMASHANTYDYQGGALAILNVHTGEVLALTNYPEFDPAIMSAGEDREVIQSYASSPKKPFLNRTLAGLYTPGSTVKPFFALGALHDQVITDETEVFSDGSIEVPNPYNPDEPSIFRDWKEGGHGWTDVTKAIGESVNTFFYAISGGYGSIRSGIGISGIERYARMFGFGSETGLNFGTEAEGVIPNPTWKRQVFNGDSWRLGDTYITSIGQFGFQVTPMQMARGMAALANSGKLVTPRIVRGPEQSKYIDEPISTLNYQLIRDGLRYTVTDGTAQNLDRDYISIAAKTGTAQVGAENAFINSWAVGFFPYETPQYAFALVMERGPNEDTTRGASWVIREALDSLAVEYPEFFQEMMPIGEEISIDQTADSR
jgi:penicillin-binding protein 2